MFIDSITTSSRVSTFLFIAVALWGCDSGTNPGSGSPLVTPDPTDVANILNVSPRDHSSAQKFRSIAQNNDSGAQLLTNGDFTDQANGWISCNGDPITVSDIDGQAVARVAPNNCIQQGVKVTPGDTLVLQCNATRVASSGRSFWTGVGLSFYDDSWNFISEPNPALVSYGDEFRTWQVSGVVPEGTSNAGVWIYSEPGALVNNCELVVSDGTPPRPQNLPLLNNPNFDEVSNSKPVGWTDFCGGSVQSYGTGNPLANVILSDGACLTQSLDPSAVAILRGQEFVFSCDMFANAGGYGEISSNLPGTHTAELIARGGGGGGTVYLYGTAADDIDNAYVSIYYEGARQHVLDCRLNIYNGGTLNQRPIAADDYFEFPMSDTPIDIADLRVTDNDSDTDGELNYGTFYVTEAPSFGTAEILEYGKISYRSTVRADDSFRYIIADDRNRASSEATVFITYTNSGTNLPPIALNDEVVLTPGYQPQISVKENDYDPDGTFTSAPQIIRQPRHGTATVNGDNIKYNYANNGATSDSLEYRITDVTGASDTATVSIGIAPTLGGEARVAKRGMINPAIDGVISDREYENAAAFRRPVNAIEYGDSFDGVRDRYRFSGLRIGHDDQYLYIATAMYKFVQNDSYPQEGSLWQDDSFEIFFDLGNEGTVGYDSNDFVRIFSFGKDTPDIVTGINSQAALSHEARCTGNDTNMHLCEVRFDLAEMGLNGPGERTFGFDIQWNLDNDGGEREAKFSWCAEEGENNGSIVNAWRDISTIDCTITLTD